MYTYIRRNTPVRRVAIVTLIMLMAGLTAWAKARWDEREMPNNYSDFDQSTWIWDSESSAIERRPKPDAYPTEEIRTVEYVTMHQDCQTLSLQGSAYQNLKSASTLPGVFGAEQSSRYGGDTRSAYLVFSTDWTLNGLTAVSNGDGTSRVTLTIRRAGVWQDDPNVDVE